MSDCKQQLRDQVKRIAEYLENPPEVLVDNPALTVDEAGLTYDDGANQWVDGDGNVVDVMSQSGFYYLYNILDIEYRVGSDREYRSAEILVAFGGPDIWIDTKSNMVKGAWWGDYAEYPFEDNIGLDDACQELFNC